MERSEWEEAQGYGSGAQLFQTRSADTLFSQTTAKTTGPRYR